jgi:hypothetical protein
MEGPDVRLDGGALEIVGVGLDGVIQGGGQLQGGFDAGGAQVFGQDGGSGAVAGPDIHHPGLAVFQKRMVVDDEVIGMAGKVLVMPRLGVHNGLAVELLQMNLLRGTLGMFNRRTMRSFWGRVMGRMWEMVLLARRRQRMRFKAQALAKESGSASMRMRRRSSWERDYRGAAGPVA